MIYVIKDQLEKLARTLLQPINPAVIVILGIYTVLWGFWVISPWWNVFAQSALYSVMASLAPEYAWGFFAIFCGSIVIRGAMKPIYWNLDIGALVGSMFWWIIAICYFISDFASTGGLTALTFAIYSGLIWLNVRQNKEQFGYDTTFLDHYWSHGK